MFMKKLFYIFALVAFTLLSCNDNEVDIKNNAINESSTGLLIKKVRKLENPYTVSNMKKAYSALQQEGLMKAALNIEATHLYVRFLPKDSTELETMFGDTTLTLFSYPLDYELTEGEKYIDSTLIGNDFTWLYTRVPVGYSSPISEYEVIEQLFLPMIVEENQMQGIKSQKVSSSISNEWWNILEGKSFDLTGNSNSLQINNSTHNIQKAPNRWTPKATIRVADTIRIINKVPTYTYVPLQGVEVRARSWFNWEKGFTDVNGKATMSGSFRGNVNWSIVWDSHDWDIRSGYYGQAFYNGPNGSKSDWNLDIEIGGKSFVYGHIHRACYNYWNNNLGLKKPFVDNFWKQKIKIAVYDKAGRSYFGSSNRWLFGSPVAIYELENDGSPRSAARIYNTTIHELAHVSHWEMGQSDFYKADDRVVESFAVGVAYVFSAQVYSAGQIPHGDFQSISFNTYTAPAPNGYESKYTALVIDLMDNINQRALWGINRPVDNVSGYTIAQIETAMKGAKTLEKWRDNLRDKYDNPTENNLDELFNN